ncbi:MAG: DUF4838 domain-containing protein [Planctomycetota bacterium]|nr:DUF4838 domain-containing protein [Planctomycetota bacterium]
MVAADQSLCRDAAQDLCHYLSRVSGQEIQQGQRANPKGLTIHVGQDAFVAEHAPRIAELRGDGFLIQTLQAEGAWHLVLAGKLERSAQWAVERFLHDFCGVRWLFPDRRYGEVVPQKATLNIPSDLAQRHEPDYLSRSNCGMYYFSPARKLLRLGSYGDGYGGHAIQHIFAAQEFREHPEWFAQFDGKRQWWSYGNGWQICTTQPGTVRRAVDYIDAFFANNPNTAVVSIGQNHGNGWCECEQCTDFVNSFSPPYTLSDRWFHWVNLVASEVRSKHPGKWVESMAYSGTSTPPRFNLQPNVAITKTFVLESEFQQAEKWKTVCNSVNMYSYMYGASFLGFRHYPRAAQDFLKWGHEELGAMAHVTECGGDWPFDGPKYYYLQALQWDVDANVDQIMDEYCSASYGAAAAPMRLFWDRLEAVYQRRKPGPYRGEHKDWLFYQWVSWSNSSYVQPNDEFREYTAADIQFLEQCVRDAQSLAAKDSPAVQFRLQRLVEAWTFQRTLLTSYVEFSSLPLQIAIENDQQARQTVALARRVAQVRAERTTALSQMRNYPHINPRISSPGFWSWASAVSLFSHEETLLDALCSAITSYQVGTQGAKPVQAYWERILPTNPLSRHAQTQLASLRNPAPTNLLTNGGFETGNLDGWKTETGALVARPVAARSGNYGAASTARGPSTLSQSVKVSPFERYRLTGWFQMTSEPPSPAVPPETSVEFFDGSHQIYAPPIRMLADTLDPTTGWNRLQTMVTVPPHAETARVRLRHSFAGSLQWDDIRFSQLLAGPKIQHGTLHDDFAATRLDPAQWVRMPGQGGTTPPPLRDGWLTWTDASYPISTLARFNSLLEDRRPMRYRLRFHIKADQTSTEKAGRSMGLSIGNFRQPTTRLLWYLYFTSANRSQPMLSAFDDQSGRRVYANSWQMPHLANRGTDLWCTMYFDTNEVAVYVAENGYQDSPGTLVCRYSHKLSNLTANGSAYLTLYKGSYQLDEISLRSAPDPAP